MKKMLIVVMVFLASVAFGEQSLTLSGGYADSEIGDFSLDTSNGYGSLVFKTGKRISFDTKILYLKDTYGYGLGISVDINPKSPLVFSSSIEISTIHDYCETLNGGLSARIPFKQWFFGVETKYLYALDTGYDDLYGIGLFTGINF